MDACRPFGGARQSMAERTSFRWRLPSVSLVLRVMTWVCLAAPGLETPSLAQEIPPAPADSISLEQELTNLRLRLEALEGGRAAEPKPAPAAKPAGNRPSVNWTGQLQADFYTFDQDEQSKASFGDIENGEAFRRARIGMFGDHGPAEYRIEVDFALAGRPSFLDVYAGVNDVPGFGRIRVGHFFEPFSLERITPNRFVTFLERTTADSAFAPARNMGIMANKTYAEERGTWAAGAFRSDSDVFGDDVGDNFETAFTSRVTFLPIDDCDGRNLLHLGAAGSIRGANGEIARFRSQPEARLGAAIPNVPFFVDTGPIATDSFQLLGLEAAWVHNSLSLQGEFIAATMDSHDSGSLFFPSWYVFASYFLTGEHRPYRREFGIFDRVKPLRDAVRYAGQSDEQWLDIGPGAWEVALRVSGIDLDDGAVSGGRLTDLTAGFNWYLSPYLRWSFNYIHAFATDSAGRKSNTNIVGTRVGFEF